MKPLKQILLYIRNLIDKIIIKIEPPQPISFKPFPQISYNSLTTDPNNYGWHTSDYSASNCTVTNNTYDGITSSGINIYDSVG